MLRTRYRVFGVNSGSKPFVAEAATGQVVLSLRNFAHVSRVGVLLVPDFLDSASERVFRNVGVIPFFSVPRSISY